MLPKAKSVDILLLLEGTYPYIQGGVSSWVHAIIRGFPDYRFGVVFLGSEPSAYKGVLYTLPTNLVHVETHYLHDISRKMHKPTGNAAMSPAVMQDLKTMHESFLERDSFLHSSLSFESVVTHLMEGRVNEGHFHSSREAWNMMTALYKERSTEPSFIDYFWTVRSMHEPIWILANIARNLIDAKCYHSVSTGYAGFLGSLLTKAKKKPFILSEHGLYTKERKIDLFHKTWAKPASDSPDGHTRDGSYFRELWIRFFEVLGKSAYASADPIVSLYEGIRLRQIDDGASAPKTLCIPNGIDLMRFSSLREKQLLPPKPIFTLIGRVVPIKDIKTFIRAMRKVCNQIPNAEGWIVGPTDENPSYYEECVALRKTLALTSSVQFLGFRNVTEIMPNAALMILSSISEALPLTLLEGFAAGVPAVATNVGSCQQLIEGIKTNEEDIALGHAGRIVNIGDPESLAEAIIGIYTNPNEWSSARSAGIQRVEKYYTDTIMLNSYAEIYSGSAVA